MVAKTNAQRQTNRDKQEDYRARMALLGMREVRGIFLHHDDHARLKRFAERLRRARDKAND